MDIGLLGVSPSVLGALHQAGFTATTDLVGIKSRELANVAKITLQEAACVLGLIAGTEKKPLGLSAMEMFEKSKTQTSIRTYIPDLDEILGGGIPIGEITEICGVPGIGKTQLSIHLAFCSQLRDSDSTCQYECIYIDTEGSFLVPRVKSMADSIARDLVSVQGDKDELLRGITYYRVYDYQEQHDVLLTLSHVLATRPKVRLVIVDSIAFHCRHAFDDTTGRARALHNMTATLRKLLQDYPIAIVLINHVTTSVADNSESTIVPALGETWSHSITTRIFLSWENQIRTAQVVKSIVNPPHKAYFEVNELGVRPYSRKRNRSEENSPTC